MGDTVTLRKRIFYGVSIIGIPGYFCIQSFYGSICYLGKYVCGSILWKKGLRSYLKGIQPCAPDFLSYGNPVFDQCHIFPDKIMYLLTNDPDLITMGSEYLRYVGISCYGD